MPASHVLIRRLLPTIMGVTGARHARPLAAEVGRGGVNAAHGAPGPALRAGPTTTTSGGRGSASSSMGTGLLRATHRVADSRRWRDAAATDLRNRRPQSGTGLSA